MRGFQLGAAGRRYRRSRPSDRTDADGTVFDSRGEMLRWHELRLLERSGVIADLERQVSYDLIINGKPIVIRSQRYKAGRPVKYSADFRYRIADTGEVIVEEYKGLWTDVARLKIAVVEAIYGVRVQITGEGKQV